MMNIKRWIAQFNFYLFLLFLAGVSFFDLLMIYLFDIWLLSYAVDFILNKRWVDIKLRNRNSIFIFYALVFLFSLLSVAYSENKVTSWLIILRQLPIIIISIIGILGLNNYYDFETSLKALIIGFILSCFIILTIAFYDTIISGYNRGDLYYNQGTFFQEVIGIFKHRTYFGLVGLFTLISVSYLLFRSKLTRIELYTYILGIILIVSIILLSEARMAIISIFCLSILIPVFERRRILRKRLLYILIFILVAVFSLVFITIIPRYNQLLSKEIFQTEKLLKLEPRMLIWENNWQLIKSHWIFGVGLGDVQDMQNEIYHLHNIFQDVSIEYNAHNQFMQSLLEGGILALISLILAISGTMYVLIKRQNYVGFFFCLVLSMSFMVETILHRITGIILFAITPLMLIIHQDTSIKNLIVYRSVKNIFFIFILIVIIFSFFSIFSILFFRPQFNPKNPNTFASQPYLEISYQDLKNDSLPKDTKGFKINEGYFLHANDREGHSYMVILSKVVQDGDSVVASLECKISKDFENGIVGFAIGGPMMGYDIVYADTNKQAWQELKVNRNFIKGEVRAVIIYNSTNNNTPPTGSVIFAYPKFQIISNLTH